MADKELPSAHVGKRGEGINGGSGSNISTASIAHRQAVRNGD